MFNLFKKTPKEQQKILFFCGAGISQESGLNTFRDSNGLWENHDLDRVCNFNTFFENKEEVFSFYNDRKSEILKAKPNSAHRIITQIQEKYQANNTLIFTSNIDNLLTQAGCKNVIHVHGNIFDMQCTECGHIWSIGNSLYDIKAKCLKCNSLYVKPAIVFFNEPAPKYKILRESFERGGPIIKGEIVNNIKVIVGTSFKVIKPEIFRLARGHSIVVDKVLPELKSEKCDKIILKPATHGLEEVRVLIDDWYIKN
jgi:NAD-dependent deacetylase